MDTLSLDVMLKAVILAISRDLPLCCLSVCWLPVCCLPVGSEWPVDSGGGVLWCGGVLWNDGPLWWGGSLWCGGVYVPWPVGALDWALDVVPWCGGAL